MSEGFSPQWLSLREPADAAARSPALARAVTARLDRLPDRPVRIHDLGCGTGSMGRWLAPRLPGPQHWVLHDLDPDLLALAAASLPGQDRDGRPLAVDTVSGDLARLTAADLAGAHLVTASALLDLLTATEVEALVSAIVGAGCPALLTLSVIGEVQLDPADPLDLAVGAAFNAHQRRTVDGRALLGPDAAAAARTAFAARGWTVTTRPSPWLLGEKESALAAQWLAGWIGAAREQDPALPLGDYLPRRSTRARNGRLDVVVVHHDLLAEPSDRATRI